MANTQNTTEQLRENKQSPQNNLPPYYSHQAEALRLIIKTGTIIRTDVGDIFCFPAEQALMIALACFDAESADMEDDNEDCCDAYDDCGGQDVSTYLTLWDLALHDDTEDDDPLEDDGEDGRDNWQQLEPTYLKTGPQLPGVSGPYNGTAVSKDWLRPL